MLNINIFGESQIKTETTETLRHHGGMAKIVATGSRKKNFYKFQRAPTL